MPQMTDMRIRVRLLIEVMRRYPLRSAGLMFVPAFMVILLVVQTGEQLTAPQLSRDMLVAEVYAAQAVEAERAAANIYHLVREIKEGKDKPQYVAAVMGMATVTTARVDVVETYQHNDTALARITSNNAGRSFEVFLARQHDDEGRTLHHFGVDAITLSPARKLYDEAHNLASLYREFTTLGTPALPTLSSEATFVRLDEVTNQAVFSTRLSDTIVVESYIDLETYLIVEDVLYVTAADNRYEMTRVTYRKREVLPAAEFERIFDPKQYDFEVVATERTG